MAQTLAIKTRLRRSLSEHVKDSTNKARDVFWRSVRERRLWEIEAREACDWLRAAGFPQYVQLFKDGRFPIDTEAVKEDHSFLDKDSLDSLCRRLLTLNKCMEMRLELWRSKRRGDDWEEEDYCTISPNWIYDKQTQHWRRINSSEESPGPRGPSPCEDHQDVCSIHSSSSTDSERHDGHRELVSTITAVATDEPETSRSSSRCSSSNRTPSLDTSLSGPPSPTGGSSTMSLEAELSFPEKPPRKKCTTLLRKMEKLRLRGAGSGHSRTRHDISGPVLVRHKDKMYRQLRQLNLQVQPNSHSSSSPSSSHNMSSSSSSTSQSENSSTVSTPSPVTRVRSNCKRSNSGVGMQSDMSQNNQNQTETEVFRNQVNNNNSSSLVFQVPHGHKPGTFPTSLAHKHIISPIIDSSSVNWRTGSFHGYRGRHSSRRGTPSLEATDQDPTISSGRISALDHRLSVYDNMPNDNQLSEGEGGGSDVERISEESEVSPLMAAEDVFSALDSVLERINDLQQLVVSWSENISEDDCQRGSSSSSHNSPAHGSSGPSPCPSSPSHIHLEVQHPEEEDASEKVTKESKTSGSQQPRRRVSRQLCWYGEQTLASLTSSPGLESRSASQILQLQKLSLLKLTALMDKYYPSSKQGWSWTVPKTLTKAKTTTEVKGQQVFGVPLLVSVQQTGEPLPPCILRALVYLRTECLDQLGLFRKPGLKSRIQYLRETVESDPEGFSYEGQSAFDVADMVKQYFRDLPEPIFTSKLCGTFLHIFQYFPKDQQLVAAQAAILLLPDENREALRTLLFFLRDVVACVDENQMTPTNIAVCLAPSLFHLNTIKRDPHAARSGHRKYSLGRPDQRDLSENLAATQGLSIMIAEAQRLFKLPEFWPGQSLLEDPPAGGVEDLEESRSRLHQITQQLLSDSGEKSGGWEKHPALENVELAFKKMNDGCPLWMWRGSVEVDAPQTDLLHRLLREQQLWEENLRQAAVIRSLSKDMEVYRYTLQGQGHDLGSHPPQENLLLRTWQADPSCGPLYLSSISTELPEVQVEGVRVNVHCCLYSLEPTGATKTKLTHLCRTDTRGRSPAWHCKVSGHLLASRLLAIRDSFKADYKETKI
ncbi:PREDICTED: rho GTPase-activating protein 7-like isoform X1 [Cyprinodon variegatus]|uniref:rho GTPase-activating protein 7-like isoform X1 n=1 Tax=Cyprinodon variegatus TaxID=28743 RepID=UPI0007427087|nr:PREDICTED: rho GTPase-activating protein 7-like isoform X1 [Cyprinodon variegatus]